MVGIVGGVSAGKSSVLRHVRKQKLLIIDADRIGHRQLSDAGIRETIVQEFGPQVLGSDGEIDRKHLAAEVFADGMGGEPRRLRLNEILHPAIGVEIQKQIREAPHDVDIVILDAALLLEAGWADNCEALIFLDTPLEQRQQRAAAARKWSADEHARREATQWSLDRKRAASDFVVDNSRTLEDAARQLEECLEQINNTFHRTT